MKDGSFKKWTKKKDQDYREKQDILGKKKQGTKKEKGKPKVGATCIFLMLLLSSSSLLLK